MPLRTSFGTVGLKVWRGKNPGDGRWGIPIRQRWGLSPHQRLSPALQDKLAYFATVAGTYESAAALAGKVGIPIEDSTVRQLVQRLGARAEEQTQKRLQTEPAQRHPQRGASPLALIMIDGYQVRHRGPDWGRRKARKPRVEWHEQKVGVFYHQDRNGQGQIVEKVSVGWQGEALELGERLHWQARRHGLSRARHTLAVGDGAPWIWRLVQARWKDAHQALDFYHASQHLHALAEALCPRDPSRRQPWVDQQCHDLRHGKEKTVLKRVAQLPIGRGARAEVIRREQNYFASHRRRMNDQQLSRRGWPIGSGAVESACAQRQRRFKRPGQFWTADGLRHLNALIEARDLNHWDELWVN
jgi:Uncharacterised protein family (UPF0236)